MSQVNEVRKVALFKSSFGVSLFVSESTEYMNEEYIRMSEEVEVTFQSLPVETQVNLEINHIDKEIDELRTRTVKKLEELEQRKQELLAIGFDGENK